MIINLDELTRLTVVDGGQRVLEKWGVNVKAYVQDDGRTLKVFIERDPEKPAAPESGWLTAWPDHAAGEDL